MRSVNLDIPVEKLCQEINEGSIVGENGFLTHIESPIADVDIAAGVLAANPVEVRTLFLNGKGQVRVDWQFDVWIRTPALAALLYVFLQGRPVGGSWTNISAAARFPESGFVNRQYHGSGFGIMALSGGVDYEIRVLAYHSSANGSTTTLRSAHLAAMGNIAQRKV